MSGNDLSQSEAERLIKCEKQAIPGYDWVFPSGGGSMEVKLVSATGGEELLTVNRRTVSLSKMSHSMRYKKVVMLIRLCIHGARHRNPDGERIPPNHLHIYREGFGDKWAMPVSEVEFPSLSDPERSLIEFMAYCNITRYPNFQSAMGI